MSSGNGAGDAARPTNLSQLAVQLFNENQDEIAGLCARLCQLIPVGAEWLIALDVTGRPSLVLPGGKAVGKQLELIQVSRPASFLSKELRFVPAE